MNDYIRNWDGLLRLVTDGITESTQLDFKRDAYGDSRKPPDKQAEDKVELRRDGTAFANSGGGILLIGVEEDAQGRAGSVPGICGAPKQEGWVRDVLIRFIEPPFTKSALQVHTVPIPGDETRGVVVVQIQGCEPGLPHAVLGDGRDVPLDFWIRTDKSKRRMTYLQLRANFRPDSSSVTQQSVDAIAISKIHESAHALHDSHDNAKKALQLLEGLRRYTAERYGLDVRQEVVIAARQALQSVRTGIPMRVARTATQLTKSALHYGVTRPSYRRLSDADADLLLEVVESGWPLVKDGIYYPEAFASQEEALAIIGMGSSLLGEVLRISHLNALEHVEAHVLNLLKSAREMAQHAGQQDAVRALDYQRAQAFEANSGPYVKVPEGLRWVIRGEEGPNPKT